MENENKQANNIIGYVPDIKFTVLLRKSLYRKLTFLYKNWNYFTSVEVNNGIYLLNCNYKLLNEKNSLTF